MHKTSLLGSFRVFIVLLAVLGCEAHGESLHIAIDRTEISAYDIVSVTITLTVEGPGAGQLQPRGERDIPVAVARRRLRAVIRNERNTVISDTPLFREWGTPEARDSRAFECKGTGFLIVSGQAEESSSDSEMFIAPGKYSIVVTDRRNSLKSNPVQISVSHPDAHERSAAEVFLRAYPDGIKLIMEHEASDATIEIFRELAGKYAETDLGRIAILALALERGKTITKQHGGSPDPPKWKPVGDDISLALENMRDDHPLRAEALFELYAARERSEQPEKARAVLAQLDESNSRGKWRWLGRRAAKEHRNP